MADAYQGGYGAASEYGPGPPSYSGDGGGYGPSPEQYGYEPRYSDPGGGQQVAPSEALGGDEDAQSYQKYTEGFRGRSLIDTETGIAPRRCTDCICLFVFLFYVLGMIILVSSAKSSIVGNRPWGDIRRLTHGHDFKGRLCGVDAGVEDKPYLFWCRNDAVETGPSPSTLNLEFPSCVKQCPTADGEVIPCLFQETVQQMTLEGGPFATTETYHVQFQQSTAMTHPYDTVAFGGRFCVPTNTTMKAQVLHGPMKYSRLFYSVGSLQDPWAVLFQATVLSIALGYVYVFLIRIFPKFFIFVFLYVTWALFTVAALFFLYAVVGLIAWQTNNAVVLDRTKYSLYVENNPLFTRYSPNTAAMLSVGVSLFFWTISCGILGTITHVAGGGGSGFIPELVEAASECWSAMQSMLVPPGLEALLKFLLLWALGYNFMYLVSVGWYEERRLMVNEQLYKDETAVYHFDLRVLPWILYYLYGWVWIMELTTAFGQYLISFCVISWYFMKKDGDVKVGVPPMPPVHGTIDGAVYHAGSLCLGAAIIPWVRVIRIFNWIEDESVPNQDAACCPGENGCQACINAICKCIGGCCAGCTRRRKACTPACCATKVEAHSEGLFGAGCAYRYMKNAYNDVIIRSQHFLQASQRSLVIIHKYESTKQFLLEGQGCQIITAVGVVSIGCIGMVYTYLVIMRVGDYTDPTSSNFIAEPIAISLMAFFLCGSIGHSFMMLFDHTADTLLYCYAWNKKFNQDSGGNPIDDYMPESLRDLIDNDMDQSDGYCLYGQARPEMYLHTWLPSKRRVVPQPREDKSAPSVKDRGSAAGSARGGLSPAPSSNSVPSRAPSQNYAPSQSYGYAPSGQTPSYQAVPGGYGPVPGAYSNPGPGYYDQGYSPGGYGGYGGAQR